MSFQSSYRFCGDVAILHGDCGEQDPLNLGNMIIIKEEDAWIGQCCPPPSSRNVMEPVIDPVMLKAEPTSVTPDEALATSPAAAPHAPAADAEHSEPSSTKDRSTTSEQSSTTERSRTTEQSSTTERSLTTEQSSTTERSRTTERSTMTDRSTLTECTVSAEQQENLAQGDPSARRCSQLRAWRRREHAFVSKAEPLSETGVQQSAFRPGRTNHSKLRVLSILSREKSRCWRKDSVCLYCQKPQRKLPRHLFRYHANEPEVMKALSLEKGSVRRRYLLSAIQNKGNFNHNVNAINKGEGVIIPKKRCRMDGARPVQYLPCGECLGFYKENSLARHKSMCGQKNEGGERPSETLNPPRPTKLLRLVTSNPIRPERLSQVANEHRQLSKQLPLVTRSPTRTPPHSPPATSTLAEPSEWLAPPGSDNLAAEERFDHVTLTCIGDDLIVNFARELAAGHGGREPNASHVHSQMRMLGRLLEVLRKSRPDATLADYVRASRFDELVAAVRRLAEREVEAARASWLMGSIGAALCRCVSICRAAAMERGDAAAKAAFDDFVVMYLLNWHLLSSSAQREQAPQSGRVPTPADVEEGSSEENRVSLDGDAQLDDRTETRERQHVRRTREPHADTRPATEDDGDSETAGERRAEKKERRTILRRRWSAQEKSVIHERMGAWLDAMRVPRKTDCEAVLAGEPALARRTWREIKFCVNNIITKRRRCSLAPPKHVPAGKIDVPVLKTC